MTRARVLLICAGAVLAALLVGGLVWLSLPKLAILALTPQARWARRTFSHYRLDYHISGLVDCRVEADVQAEAVTSSQTTPQGGGFCAIMTVTGLFERIDKLAEGPRCGPNGCGCDGPITMEVVYDDALGYPRLIERQVRPDLRWRYFEYWVHRMVQGGCTAIGYLGTRIEVTALAPLP